MSDAIGSTIVQISNAIHDTFRRSSSIGIALVRVPLTQLIVPDVFSKLNLSLFLCQII